MPVFKCICSYNRSRSANGPVPVREDTCLYLNVSVHTNSYGQLTVHSRSAHGPITVMEDICLHLNSSVHTNGYGQLTVHSRSAHGPVAVREDICLYLNVHTNGHGHVRRRSTKRGYFKKNTRISGRKFILLPSDLYRSRSCACSKQNEMSLTAVRAFSVQLYPYP